MTDETAAATRTPAEIREQGNRLAGEPSLYLRQHANNPVDWYPWGDVALGRARDEDKLIFLSVGYSSCHWCHVMEHEVFEDDDVAAYLNDHYVCIKVDREERPDLDATYMEAVQLLTGSGGWPMSVFLTPELKPFWGGTYFPRDAFLELVTRIQDVRAETPDDLVEQASRVAARISARPQVASVGGVTEAMIDGAASMLDRDYDPVHGGVGNAQKFPTPTRWRFLLHRWRRTGDETLEAKLVQTLEAMARGGLYDHVGGGFHRYTVDRDWTVPHFEKMLYDNAQLASLYFEAGVAMGRPDFTAVGRDVLDFLLREMRDERGAFFASFDADSGGEEGSYYIWSRAQLEAIGSAELADLLGVDERGNFEHSGSSVVTRRTVFGDEADALFEKWRSELRRLRAERTPPGLDRKIITAWNGLVVSALARGYAATGEERYLQAALDAADFLLREHRRDDGSLIRASSDGRTAGHGILDDYAFLAEGLLEVHQVSGDLVWLRAAREITDRIIADFADERVFTHAGSAADSPLGRRVELFDSVLPAGNSTMLLVLTRLAAVTGRTEFLDRARAHLDTQSGLLERAGLEMAGWFDAADVLGEPFFDVVVAGDPADSRTIALLEAARSQLSPGVVVSVVPAAGPGPRVLAEAPALAGKVAIGGEPTAYVCEFGVCRAPTADPVELRRQVMADWKH